MPGSDVHPASLRVTEAGERALIERIRRRLPAAPPGVIVGIGDDAAVTEPERGALQVLTTDALVEGVHFDRRFCSPADIGYKALAVNVSDVASMGGAPSYALLSLMLPDTITLADVDGLLDGLLEIAVETRTALVGGNITRSPGPLAVDVTVVGTAKRRKVLTRAGAGPGDAIYVTGAVGAGAAGLEWLRQNSGADPGDSELAECVSRYRRPMPRTRIGALLGRTRAASGCMDTSDGLADAVRQMCEASGVGAKLDASALPIHPALGRRFEAERLLTAALAGGDDYELLFTVPKRRKGRFRGVYRERRGVAITRIGEITADRAIGVAHGDALLPLPAGYTHF